MVFGCRGNYRRDRLSAASRVPQLVLAAVGDLGTGDAGAGRCRALRRCVPPVQGGRLKGGMEARLPSAWRRSPAAVSHAYEMRQRGAPRTEVMHPFGNQVIPGAKSAKALQLPVFFLAGRTPVLGAVYLL